MSDQLLPNRIMYLAVADRTTSRHMDAYAPKLLSLGLRGMIGKGYRQLIC